MVWSSLFLLVGASAASLSAQTVAGTIELSQSEVRQIVTFSFLPGKSAEAIAAFREQAIPLYEQDEAMLSFRGFREVESPIPLDLIVVSAFRGMAGMDASNAALRTLARQAGSSIGALYGGIGALASGHADQFVEMLPPMGAADPFRQPARGLTAFVWYRILAGESAAFEALLEKAIVPWEQANGIPSATGRFLVSDGWDYMRFLAFDSLRAYHDYWSRLRAQADHAAVDGLTAERREVIVAPVAELSVR